MKKSTIVKLSITGILLLSIVLGAFMFIGTGKFRDSKTFDLNDEKIKFSQTLTEKATAEGATQLDMAECTYFGWDEGYAFAPYYSAKDAYKTVGSDWTRKTWYYQYIFGHSFENTTTNDGQVLFVFVDEGKPVASGIVETKMIFGEENYVKFTADNCLFTVDGGALTYQPAEKSE